MQPGPSCLVTSQPQYPLQPQSADTVLLCGYPPDRPEPRRQRGVRVLEDRSRGYRDLVTATRTLPPNRTQWPRFVGSAAWRSKSRRLSELEQILSAGLLRVEARLQLRNIPGVILVFHRRAYYRLWSPESSGYPHSRILDDVLGGWTIGGIQNYASGSPISFGCADTIPGTGNCVRWNFTGTSLLSNAEKSGTLQPSVDNYFLNPGVGAHQVFVDPEVNVANGGGYQLGGLSPDTPARGYQAIGTSGLMESFNVPKQFAAGERAHAEIRLELFNAFNRHQFAVPDSNPNDLAFGNVTNSQISPRQLQLTARIRF